MRDVGGLNESLSSCSSICAPVSGVGVCDVGVRDCGDVVGCGVPGDYSVDRGRRDTEKPTGFVAAVAGGGFRSVFRADDFGQLADLF